MNININFNTKEITILSPISVTELVDRLKELNLEEFKIVSKVEYALQQPYIPPTYTPPYIYNDFPITCEAKEFKMFNPMEDAKIVYVDNNGNEIEK